MANNKLNAQFFLRAFRYRNYSLFFGGESVSRIGTWMQQITIGWLVYRLTGSVFILGIVGFLSQLPIFLITPFAGVFIDRWDRRRLLIITQVLSTIQALLLFALFTAGIIAIWHIIVLGVFLGLVSAFEMPARQVFVVDIVENKEDMGNAIALNSALVNIARLIGPFLAGIIIAWKGEGVCFLLNALSYFTSIIALMLMRTVPMNARDKGSARLDELKEGFAHVLSLPVVRSLIVLLALTSLMGMSYQTLMPVFVKDILRKDARILGFLMGASGLGALTGAFFLASRIGIDGFGRIILTAVGIFGSSLALFSLSRNFWICFFFIFCSGVGMMILIAGSNTVIQTVVHNNKRGRVMSLFVTAFVGIMPFGSLLSGWMARFLGAPNTILTCGIIALLGIVLCGRQIYNFNYSNPLTEME